MAILDEPGHVFEFVNAAYMELFGRRDLVGRALPDALPELRQQGFVALLDTVYSSGQTYVGHDLPTTLSQPPSTEAATKFFDFVYQPIIDADGAVTGIFVQGHDVTSRVEARAAANLLQAGAVPDPGRSSMDSISATLAHELNQPLTIITNTVRAARRFLADPTPDKLIETDSALADVEDAALRAGELIRRLRDTVSRGHVRDRPEQLAQIVDDALALSRTALAEHRVRCRIDVADDIMICGDRIQLQQVLLNLINNAIEAMADTDRRTLVIEARIEAQQARICVQDSGPGLPEYAEAQAFNLLFTTKSTGLGLGLSICRSIVEAHDGVIWVTESPGGGAAFCFTLPLFEDDASVIDL